MSETEAGRDELESRQFTALGADLGVGKGEDQEAPEKQKISNEQIIAGAIASGREVFCAVTGLKSPRRTLGDDQAGALGGMWAPVLNKHGIDLGAMIGDYAVEFAAIFGTITIAMAVRAAAVAEMKAMGDSEQKPEPTPVQEAEIVG